MWTLSLKNHLFFYCCMIFAYELVTARPKMSTYYDTIIFIHTLRDNKLNQENRMFWNLNWILLLNWQNYLPQIFHRKMAIFNTTAIIIITPLPKCFIILYILVVLLYSDISIFTFWSANILKYKKIFDRYSRWIRQF